MPIGFLSRRYPGILGGKKDGSRKTFQTVALRIKNEKSNRFVRVFDIRLLGLDISILDGAPHSVKLHAN